MLQTVEQGGIPCPTNLGTEYGDHVHLPGSPIPWNPTAQYSAGPIFDDLYGCHLPAISWVIPDGSWSDHPSTGSSSTTLPLGPDWVGDIVDGVGQACGGKYWSGSEPTAVIVTWDDWGGWYDHIKPWAYYRSTLTNSCPPSAAPNGWGCGYDAGFRVPLLVVSAWTGQQTQNGVTGYVSGACGQAPLSSCPNFGTSNVYVHDFGSILAFTEWNFGMKNIDQSGDSGYADLNAPDVLGGNIALMDFFQLPLNSPRSFVSVTTKYDYTCFQQSGKCFGSAPYVPEDPDEY